MAAHQLTARPWVDSPAERDSSTARRRRGDELHGLCATSGGWAFTQVVPSFVGVRLLRGIDLTSSRTILVWATRLDAFLDLDDRQILDSAGHISKAQADDHALSEFEKFRIIQDRNYVSDFDRLEQQAEQQPGRDAKQE